MKGKCRWKHIGGGRVETHSMVAVTEGVSAQGLEARPTAKNCEGVVAAKDDNNRNNSKYNDSILNCTLQMSTEVKI